MIAYRIEPRLPEPDEFVASVRAARARVVIVSRDGTIIAADPVARRMLDDIEPHDANRLPRVIEAAVFAWIDQKLGGDLVATPLPGLLLRAMELNGDGAPIALLIEAMSTRAHLSTAARRFGLSRRECDVLRLVLEGDSACEIGTRLQIAEYTVGDYLKRIFAKTHVRNRSEMIAKVLGWRVQESG
ncbi:MAG: LuxR C-terminal-related transcriptional regulator [Candidatus Eremiobacteraeota bacterium]|nr:LuxR C-terminal-related transcriptional regulator [Candidatus Eremiobacteraeota bacterium]